MEDVINFLGTIKVGYITKKTKKILSEYVTKIVDIKILDIIKKIIIKEIYSKKIYNEIQEYIKKYDLEIIGFIKKEIDEFQKINITKYQKMNVIFLTTIAIANPIINSNRIMIKIGYSNNIVDDLKSYNEKYEHSCHIFGLKTINNLCDFINFNKIMKLSYPKLIVDDETNDDANQIYEFDKKFYGQFIAYIDKIPFDKIALVADDVDEFFNKQLFNTTLDIINFKDTVNQYQQNVMNHIANRYYDYLLTRQEFEFQERNKIKEYDFLLKMKDKEIELLNIELKKKSK
jgi:hypothetical protein